MLTPDYLDTVADPIIEIFERLQEEILADIVRRIVKTNYITPTAEWQTMKLQESGMLLKDIKKHIQKTLNLTDEELKELFEQATIENLSGHYTKADIIKLLKRDTTMYQSILSGLEKTEGHLTNMTMTTASAYQQLFIESLDDAYWKVNSGAFDYNSAIVNATDTMLKKGQTVIEYPSGWRNAIDVAVRRAVLTGINQTQGQVQMDLAEELGLDYVDVSAHLGARPSHAEWQGKRYCISGKDKKYPKFEDATGYGTGAGLCGWNCRHTFFATTRDANFAYSQKELDDLKNRKVKYNGKDIGYYDATQMQRSMERTSRGLRRDLVAINELPDSPEKNILFAKKSARLKEVEVRYKDFSKQTGLFTQNERMRVYGYNKSLSRKVGKASEEYLTNRKFVGLSAGSGSGTSDYENIKSILETGIDYSDKALVRNTLLKYEQTIADEAIENAIVITKSGTVYRIIGELNGVDPSKALGEELRGASVTHNHPIDSRNEYSFSEDDVNMFKSYDLEILRGIDELFSYELNRDISSSDDIPFFVADNSYRHYRLTLWASDNDVGYYRRERKR